MDGERDDPRGGVRVMPTVLVWRLAAATGNIPYRDGDERARSVIIGATEEIDDPNSEDEDPDLEENFEEPGVRVWFRVLPAGGLGDRLSRDRVVVEVRDPDRARERWETATGMYLALHWVVVEPPRQFDVPSPPLSPEDIMSGYPLVVWAESVVEQFLVRP